MLFVMAERNLNPKAACLKRREEEKGTEFLTAQSASIYPDHAAQPLVVRACRATYQSHLLDAIDIYASFFLDFCCLTLIVNC